MKRSDLEHILRASKGVTGETEFAVIGSQAILGRFPDAPRVLRQSMEADLYPRYRPELAELIEGSLGRYSQFVSNENTGGAIGWCLDPHDLALSKLAARREKDLEYVTGLLRFKMVRPSRLQELIQTFDDPTLREKVGDARQLCLKRQAGLP